MGWLLCDGRPLPVTMYSQLFDVLGYSFGSSTDGKIFNLPNPQGRVLAFAGQPQVVSGSDLSGANWIPQISTSTWDVGDMSGNETLVPVSSGSVPVSVSAFQPTAWIGNMFIYSGKMYGGTDGNTAPFSTNLFPNTDFTTNPIVGEPRTFPAGNGPRPIY